jgi:negative regulator of flagellin synthesis FlgM
MKLPGDIVANKISGVEAKTARVAPAPPVNARKENPEQAASLPRGADADVHLTGAARNLAAIEQTVRAMPVVDEARVAAVKERLQNGSYETNAQRIADRLLRLESDLQRAQPFDRNPLR